MNRCLSEHALWLISEGEGDLADQHHVLACAACSARYRQLESDLRTLQTVLSGSPPRGRRSLPAYHSHRPWMTAAAAVAIAIVGIWSGVWLLSPSSPTTLPGGGQESVWSFFEEVSLALFALADDDVITGMEPLGLLPDSPALETFADGSWLCDGETWWFNSECESQPFLLLAGGQ